MGWGDLRIPYDLPAEVERAIRADERRNVARWLDGDLRRFAHVLGAVLADPPATRPERQAMARFLTKKQREFLLALLDGDLRRMALFMASLVEEIDHADPNPTGCTSSRRTS